MKKIYFDNAATTKPYSEVLKTFTKENASNYYNPSAPYIDAFNISRRIDVARKKLISYLNGDDNKDKIVFTSGATESNNLAILGSVIDKKKRYLFSMGEHPSVYNVALELKRKGLDAEFIPLSKNGEIDYDKFEDMVDSEVSFVSCMFVNNETGAINDLKRIGGILSRKSPKCIFHVDAVQGFCKIPLNVKECRINLCSLSAHKIGGVKGVGAIYISKGTTLKNITFGGGQEYTLRSGTLNSAGIFAFLRGASISFKHMESNFKKNLKLKNYLISSLNTLGRKVIIPVKENSSPYITSVLFPHNRGENIMRYLDSQNIIVGTGSACSSKKMGNRVLESMGYNKEEILGAIRISFGFSSTKEEIDMLICTLKKYFEKMDA